METAVTLLLEDNFQRGLLFKAAIQLTACLQGFRVGCFNEFVFPFFHGADACGLCKQFINNFVSPLDPALLVLIIIIYLL